MNSIDLSVLTLAVGSHTTCEEGLCFTEAVACFAGEPHTDHPVCMSAVMAKIGRRLNDALPDDLRQRLVPLVPRMVGTAGDGLDEARSYLALDWLIRDYTTVWLDLAELGTEADELRRLPLIKDTGSAKAARPSVVSARDAARIATEAATWTATRTTSWYAAWAAAAVARSAARSVARAAAGAAAKDSAGSAARAATGADVWAASGFVARRALQPTVTALQESAIDLLDRMIYGRWPEW